MPEDQKVPRIELLLDFSSLNCECHRPTIAALIAMGLDISDYLAEKDATEVFGNLCSIHLDRMRHISNQCFVGL